VNPSSEANQKRVSKDYSLLWIPLLLLIALSLVYSNSFHGPFIFDDLESIVENESIRSLSKAILQVDFGAATVSARPLLNFSFALNYAFGGLSVEAYHLVNFFIHLASTLTLFGFLRRTFILPTFPVCFHRDAYWIAGSIAALWSIHPLQTESVTYIVQRAESLMSLFYLLTLYTFLRSQSSIYPRRWLILSVFCCYCGMASKEVMVSAPLIILFYDLIFIDRKFEKLWSERRFYYMGLISSWGLMAFILFTVKSRGNEVTPILENAF
jgi:hypothetical protein